MFTLFYAPCLILVFIHVSLSQLELLILINLPLLITFLPIPLMILYQETYWNKYHMIIFQILSFWTICQTKKNSKTLKRDKRNFDIQKFQSDLLDDDLLLKIINSEDTNTAYDKFLSKYCKLLDKHAPLKKLSKKEIKRAQKPWITLGLIKSINKKRSLFKQLKKLKAKNKDADEVHKKYKYYNDMINKLKKKCKRDHYQNYFNENASNSKKVWNGINRLLNRGRKKTRNHLFGGKWSHL